MVDRRHIIAAVFLLAFLAFFDRYPLEAILLLVTWFAFLLFFLVIGVIGIVGIEIFNVIKRPRV